MNQRRRLDPEEQRTWRLFVHATKLLYQQLDRQLQRDAGMPHSYYEIMVVLSEAPDRTLRMSELADRVLSSRSRVSHAVSRLEKLSWICRGSCPIDKRGQLAMLTDEGFEALAAAAPGYVATVRAHVFEPLTATQVRQLRRISEALRDGLHEESARAPGSALMRPSPQRGTPQNHS